MKPRLLDLCAGAGGAGVGYAWAGFEVTGVDIVEHPDSPHEIIVADAMDVLADSAFLDNFDVIHGSPPCPRYSAATPAERRELHPDLIEPMREALVAWGGRYVIENVPGAPLENPIRLCGSSFGLQVRRHRLFESNVAMLQPECNHRAQGQVFGVYGDHGDAKPVTRPNGTSRGNKARDAAHAREVMGIDWMTSWDDLADAIPPLYTRWIGDQIMADMARGVAA